MKLYKLPIYVLCLLGILMNSCDEDSVVGVSIQPEEDLLQAYNSHITISTNTIVTDSILSKADYLLFGRFSDNLFGEVSAEYMTQLDARIGGIILPDTTIVDNNSATTGILNTLLSDIDSKYGKIKSVKNVRNFKIDSTQYIIRYDDDFWGDSTALQAVQVYELNQGLDAEKYYTNVKPSEFCDESILLGEANYQIKNSREINIPLSEEFGNRIAGFYMEKKGASQKDFNDFFKGVYVKHAFNEGTILKVTVSGILIYYHYDADLVTTVEGRDTVVTTESLLATHKVNPLVTSFFLSGNKSVKRANAIQHEDWAETVQRLQSKDGENTFTYTPAGVYTEVSIPFEEIMDSVKLHATDTTKVKFNSVRLVLHRQAMNNKYAYSGQLLLIEKDSLENFFFNNCMPDGITSFTCSLDSKNDLYAFNLTKPIQNRLNGEGKTFPNKMVIVPVERQTVNSIYYYKQQLWMTSTSLYGNEASEKMKPCVDVIYTKRQ